MDPNKLGWNPDVREYVLTVEYWKDGIPSRERFRLRAYDANDAHVQFEIARRDNGKLVRIEPYEKIHHEHVIERWVEQHFLYQEGRTDA